MQKQAASAPQAVRAAAMELYVSPSFKINWQELEDLLLEKQRMGMLLAGHTLQVRSPWRALSVGSCADSPSANALAKLDQVQKCNLSNVIV
jgi:hypothetical protein